MDPMEIPKEEMERSEAIQQNQEKVYDPNSSERIACVELTNNNKVYIAYKETSSIKDVRKPKILI